MIAGIAAERFDIYLKNTRITVPCNDNAIFRVVTWSNLMENMSLSRLAPYI